MRAASYDARFRVFVALVRTGRGYHATPVIALDLDQAGKLLGVTKGEVLAVLEQSHVTMLGMGLAAGPTLLALGGALEA